MARGAFVADMSVGLCEIHGGDVSKGLAILEAALASGKDTSSFRADALRALTKAYDHACKPERALACMQQLLAHITAMREKGIVALLTQAKHVDAESLILNHHAGGRCRDLTSKTELGAAGLQVPHRRRHPFRKALYGVRDHSYTVHCLRLREVHDIF